MKAVFFSDTHLGHEHDGKAARVDAFIRTVCSDADMVFVLGDLFEFYHGFHGYIYPWYKETVDALKALADRGRKVYFIEGNHEFVMGDYFSSYTGMTSGESFVVDIEGQKVFLAHGHEFASLTLARIFKSRPVTLLMDLLGPLLSWKIAMALHFLLSKRKKGQSERIKTKFRHYGETKLKEDYDVVILAHSHMPDSARFAIGTTGGKLYLNTGDLIICGSYVEYESQKGFSVQYIS